MRDEAPIPCGVGELEKLAEATDSLQLQHLGMPDLVLYMNSQEAHGKAIQSM